MTFEKYDMQPDETPWEDAYETKVVQREVDARFDNLMRLRDAEVRSGFETERPAVDEQSGSFPAHLYQVLAKAHMELKTRPKR